MFYMKKETKNCSEFKNEILSVLKSIEKLSNLYSKVPKKFYENFFFDSFTVKKTP